MNNGGGMKSPSGKRVFSGLTMRGFLPERFRVGEEGFSLVELMIAILITVLVMAGVYTTFVVQQRSFTVQDQVAETQGASKIAFDMIVKDIRTAGFGYPDDQAPSINGVQGSIGISDGTGPNGSDRITLVGGFRNMGTVGLPAARIAAGQTTLQVGDDTITLCYSNDSTTFDTTELRYLSIDGVFYAEVTNTAAGTADCDLDGTDETANVATITMDRGIDKPFPVGRPVYLIEDVVYGIDLDGASPAALQREGRVGAPQNIVTIAENVDDLQFVEIDQDADGITDRIRVSLLARTRGEDPTLEPSTKPYYDVVGIDLEGNITPVNDQYRRRIWSMEVGLRN